MWPYFIPIFLCLIACLFLPNKIKLSIGILKRYYILSWELLLLLLLLFAGMRGDGSGDYWNYLERGSAIREINDIFFNTIYMNYGYCVIAYIINQFHLPSQVIIISMNCISILCIGKFIKKYSSLPVLSVLLFLPFYFQFDMHAARTACAIGILTLATPYVIDRKPIEFATILGISALFHPESLIGVFLYFLPTFKIDITKGTIILFADLMIALPNLVDRIFVEILGKIGGGLFYAKFLGYSDPQGAFNYEAHLYDPRFILFTLLFFLACKMVSDKKDNIERLVRNASFLTIFLMIFFINHTLMVYRLSSFYSIYTIILIPLILIKRYNYNSFKINIIKKSPWYITTVLLAALLSCAYAVKMGLEVPYRIFELNFW